MLYISSSGVGDQCQVCGTGRLCPTEKVACHSGAAWCLEEEGIDAGVMTSLFHILPNVLFEPPMSSSHTHHPTVTPTLPSSQQPVYIRIVTHCNMSRPRLWLRLILFILQPGSRLACLSLLALYRRKPCRTADTYSISPSYYLITPVAQGFTPRPNTACGVRLQGDRSTCCGSTAQRPESI